MWESLVICIQKSLKKTFNISEKEHVREMFSGDSQMITIIVTIQNNNKKNKIRLAIMIVVLSNGNKTE